MGENKIYSGKTALIDETVGTICSINDKLKGNVSIKGSPYKLHLQTANGYYVGIPTDLSDENISDAEPMIKNPNTPNLLRINPVFLIKQKRQAVANASDDYTPIDNSNVVYLTDVEFYPNGGAKVTLSSCFVFHDMIVGFSVVS